MSRRCTAWATASPRTEGHEPPPPLADGAPRGDDGDNHDRRRRAVDDARLPLARRAPEPARRRPRRELGGGRRCGGGGAPARVAAVAAAHYRGGWSSRSLAELVERSRTAGFDITVTDLAGRPLTATGPGGRPHRWTAAAPIVVDGRPVGELELRPIRTDIFGTENSALRHQLNGLLEVCAALALG